MSQTAIRILFVDNGNYSRSPAAEVIAKKKAQAAGRSDQFEFASAGVIDKHVDGPADPRTIAECEKRGYSLNSFLCRKTEPSFFDYYDRVLAMDYQNLAVFSLARREGDRAVVELFDPEREVPDPFYEDDDAFPRVINMIEARIDALLRSE